MFNESGSDENRRREEARKILDMLTEMNLANCRDKDLTFIKDMNDRFRRFGSFTRVTPRQLFYLRDIKDRAI